MPKFAFLGSYSRESWARMIDKPGDRTEAVRRLVKSAGGTLECFYLMLGADDFIIIADAPDVVSAAAVSVAVSSTGAVHNTRTIQLIEWNAAPALLAKARAAKAEYQSPGG
jgi:uncharacterized protein with GYD domain